MSRKETTTIYILARKSDFVPFYIGKSNNPQKRLRQHIDNAREYKRKSLTYGYIRHLWNRGDDFIMFRLFEVPYYLWQCLEIIAIDMFIELGINLKNMSTGGRSPEMTEEIRAKISKSRMGITFSEKSREKMSIAKIGKPTWNKGIHTGRPSPMKQKYVREKVSEKLKDRVISDEWRKKISAATIGRIPANKGKRGLQGKRVLQIDAISGIVIKEFRNATLALLSLGANCKSGSISECATGKRKTAYGFAWRYCDD